MPFNNIKQTPKTPSVAFDEKNGTIVISGKCYPEDANDFFQPIFNDIKEFVSTTKLSQITITLAFEYINSSSIKHILSIVHFLDENKSNAKIKIIWHADKDDVSMYDLGKNYRNIVKNCAFEIVEVEF